MIPPGGRPISPCLPAPDFGARAFLVRAHGGFVRSRCAGEVRRATEPLVQFRFVQRQVKSVQRRATEAEIQASLVRIGWNDVRVAGAEEDSQGEHSRIPLPRTRIAFLVCAGPSGPCALRARSPVPWTARGVFWSRSAQSPAALAHLWPAQPLPLSALCARAADSHIRHLAKGFSLQGEQGLAQGESPSVKGLGVDTTPSRGAGRGRSSPPVRGVDLKPVAHGSRPTGDDGGRPSRVRGIQTFTGVLLPVCWPRSAAPRPRPR